MVSLEGISPLAVVEAFRQLSGTACFLVSQVQARTRTRTHTHPQARKPRTRQVRELLRLVRHDYVDLRYVFEPTRICLY